MKALSAIALSLAMSSAYASMCPTHLRVLHGQAFQDQNIDVLVNGQPIIQNLSFRSTSKYVALKPGMKKVSIVDAQTKEVLQEKSFMAGTNLGHTVVFAGPALGPEGTRYGNSSPFIMLDDITPPANPNRWKGTWYRMSETNVVIDFRISDGLNPAREIARLIQKPNRSTYQLGDFPAGVYQFNPVLPGSSEPFFNPALEPARNVELTNVSIKGGEIVDIIAAGNFLGKAPNSLDLRYTRYTPSVNDEGCIELNQ